MRYIEVAGVPADSSKQLQEAAKPRATRVVETFSSVLPLRWSSETNEDMKLLVANFEVGEGQFVVRFKAEYPDMNVWEISFKRNGTLDMTGTGSAHVVLSTVMGAIRQFLREHDPDHIMLAARRTEESRISLYPKLIAMMQREFPQYVAKPPHKLNTYMLYYLDRAPRPSPACAAPSPGSLPKEQPAPMSPEEWDDLDGFMAHRRAEQEARSPSLRTRISTLESQGPSMLRLSRYSKQEMIDRGADGYLDHGYERYIPIADVDGLEPEPASEHPDGEYRAGREIKQPVEVVYDHDNGNYMLYAGNHRMAQAKANQQTHIRAFVQSHNYKVGAQAKRHNPD